MILIRSAVLAWKRAAEPITKFGNKWEKHGLKTEIRHVCFAALSVPGLFMNSSFSEPELWVQLHIHDNEHCRPDAGHRAMTGDHIAEISSKWECHKGERNINQRGRDSFLPLLVTILPRSYVIGILTRAYRDERIPSKVFFGTNV